MAWDYNKPAVFFFNFNFNSNFQFQVLHHLAEYSDFRASVPIYDFRPILIQISLNLHKDFMNLEPWALMSLALMKQWCSWNCDTFSLHYSFKRKLLLIIIDNPLSLLGSFHANSFLIRLLIIPRFPCSLFIRNFGKQVSLIKWSFSRGLWLKRVLQLMMFFRGEGLITLYAPNGVWCARVIWR